MVDIAECWSQIEAWLAANAPDAIPFLPAGTSSEEFAKAETFLGFAIPREVKEFLAIHDGSAHLWFHDRGEFMSLNTILSAWDQEFDLWGDGNNYEWTKPRGAIKKCGSTECGCQFLTLETWTIVDRHQTRRSIHLFCKTGEAGVYFILG
jgi:cell wall assembly regulator SMI1